MENIFEDIFTKRNPQLARMLVGGQLEQITYREFLPVVLGETALGNLAESQPTYDQIVDPSILNEFDTVAFRWIFGIDFKYQYQYQYLSSPLLRAESARAFTGRRCPHSGKGGDFLTGQNDVYFAQYLQN